MPFIATGSIKVNGQQIAVREIELSREYQCRVLAGADGSLYLEYQVSVGLYKTEISATHILSRGQIAAREAGTLDLGRFSATLSEIAQITGKFERKDSAAVGHAAYARGLNALLHLIYLEAEVLDRIGETDSEPMTREEAAGCADKIRKWVPEMIADSKISDPAALADQARNWGARFSSIYHIVEVPCSGNLHHPEKEAIEEAIYELSVRLYETAL